MADIQVGRQTVISFPDDNITLTEGIMDASLSVSEILLSKHIAFGELNINKFEVDLHTDRDVIGKKIYVYQNIGTSVVPIFTGYVQSSKLDDFGEYRHLIAYDLFYTKGVLDVADWWDTYWESNEVSTLGALLRSLLSTFSIPYVDKVLLNDSMSITKTQEIASMKLSDMLKLICEANVCNPNIDRQGVLEFVTVYNATEKSVVDNYEWNNSDFEDYTLAQIGLVQIWNRDGHIGVSVGSGTNCLAIKNNFFFYDKETSELSTLATAIYNAVHGITYTPASIKLILQDPTIKVGDKVRSSKGVSLVTELEMSGAMLIEETLKSNGEEITAEADSYNPTDSKVKDTQKQVQQVSNSVAVLNTQVQELFRKVTNRYLLPFGIVLDEVTDIDQGGTANNVLMFRYTSNSDNNSLTIHAELNFNVHTFEKEIDDVDYFQDAIVTVGVVLDTTTLLVDFIEYMRDGWKTVNLDYLLGSAPSGTHDIYVTVQSQGASLFSMEVVSGYINALGTTASGPKDYYNVNDMSSWQQTILDFMSDTYVSEVNKLTVNTDHSGDYEKAYRQIRTDPKGTYKITFELKVNTNYSKRSDLDGAIFEVGRLEPDDDKYLTNGNFARSEAFSNIITNNFVHYELTYTNYWIDSSVTTKNYLIFNFGGIAVGSNVNFDIKDIVIRKTNSNIKFIEWTAGSYVWNTYSGGWGEFPYFKMLGELDAIVIRGVGNDLNDNMSFYSVVWPAIITSVPIDIDTYIDVEEQTYSEEKEIVLKEILHLANGRTVYLYARSLLRLGSAQDGIYCSETLYDEQALPIAGSIDVYKGEGDSHFYLSYELDDYLCERWGDPT